MKLAILVIATVFLLGGCASVSGPQAKSSVNIYRYTDAPDICFFPKDQAKWDGYKITNKNWNLLTEYQKFMFILEGVKELEKSEGVIISIEDSARTILALDYGVNKMNRDLPKTELSMISFMYDVFKQAKMVKPRKARIIKK